MENETDAPLIVNRATTAVTILPSQATSSIQQEVTAVTHLVAEPTSMIDSDRVDQVNESYSQQL